MSDRRVKDIDLVEQQRGHGGNGHDGEVIVRNVADFVRCHCFDFFFSQQIEQSACDYKARVAAQSSKGKRVRRAALNDADLRHRQPALLAELLNVEAKARRDIVFMPGDIEAPLDKPRRKQVLQSDDPDCERNSHPDRRSAM